MLTLRQLRYLDALVRHGSFGRAAEECAISQPALSMQIRELERELGVELVNRRQSGPTILTEAGTEVARRASSILSAAHDLTDCVSRNRPLLNGPLRLGVIPTLAPYVLPQLLPELERSYPHLRLDLVETQTKTLVSELGQGTLDVLLLALPVEKAEFETVSLFSDRFLLAVQADDPLPERARVTRRDVNARELVLLEEGHCLRDQEIALSHPLHRTPQPEAFQQSAQMESRQHDDDGCRGGQFKAPRDKRVTSGIAIGPAFERSMPMLESRLTEVTPC